MVAIKEALVKPVNMLEFTALAVAVVVSASIGYIIAGYIPFISQPFGALITSFAAGIVSLDDSIYDSVPIPDDLEENPPMMKTWKVAVLIVPVLFITAALFG